MAKSNHLRTYAVLLVSALAAGILGFVATGPAEAAFPGGNGKIAFQSNRNGPVEIYAMTPGETAARITTSNNSADPSYSPDGSRIAFISSSTTNTSYEVFVMNADGSGRRQVTNTSVAEQEPAWSPDGTRLVYASNSFDVDGQTDLEIWTINADGSGRTQLTNNAHPDSQPSWSPLGDKIAFVGTRTGDTDRNVYVMNADGTGEVNITPAEPYGDVTYQGHDDHPNWSPDGNQIAYVHTFAANASGVPNIWAMDANGANKVNVQSNSSTSGSQPAWSPDGNRIAYVGVASGSTDRNIYAMDANGANQAPIDTSAAHDISPDWQPNPPACDITGTNGDNPNLNGTPAAETICGLGGNDVINGGGGNDILLGGDGNDTLVVPSGRATLDGGAGKDIASFAGSTTSIEASLVTGFARRVGTNPLEGIALLGIESLIGSSLDDVLTGSNAANKLVGGAGADELYGLGGKDTLNSRDGVKRNDTVHGGGGSDKCVTDKKEASIKSC